VRNASHCAGKPATTEGTSSAHCVTGCLRYVHISVIISALPVRKSFRNCVIICYLCELEVAYKKHRIENILLLIVSIKLIMEKH